MRPGYGDVELFERINRERVSYGLRSISALVICRSTQLFESSLYRIHSILPLRIDWIFFRSATSGSKTRNSLAL